jgi:hypothetical protein
VVEGRGFDLFLGFVRTPSGDDSLRALRSWDRALGGCADFFGAVGNFVGVVAAAGSAMRRNITVGDVAWNGVEVFVRVCSRSRTSVGDDAASFALESFDLAIEPLDIARLLVLLGLYFLHVYVVVWRVG